MDYKQKIISYCKELGLDTIGFTECRVFYELKEYYEQRKLNKYENEFEEESIHKRINPYMYMEEGKAIISIAFPYLFDCSINENAYFSKYTQGKDYHLVVSNYLKKICEFIESLGGKAKYFVDSNSLPERYIASLCGIGFIGKNNTIITDKYGSYVFLGEIITDLNIEKDVPIKNKCGSCDICLKACPTASIAEGINNPNKCLSYITQKKEIKDEDFDDLKGRIFGCDTCQRVCPFNEKVKLSKIEEFRPYEYMKNVNVHELLNLNNKAFREKYIFTSCGWRGKNILIRNAMINIAQSGQKPWVDEKSINSDYIKNYFNRLLQFYHL